MNNLFLLRIIKQTKYNPGTYTGSAVASTIKFTNNDLKNENGGYI